MRQIRFALMRINIQQKRFVEVGNKKNKRPSISGIPSTAFLVLKRLAIERINRVNQKARRQMTNILLLDNLQATHATFPVFPFLAR